MFDYAAATYNFGPSDRDRTVAATERYEIQRALREADSAVRSERRAQRKAKRSAATVRRLVPTLGHW